MDNIVINVFLFLIMPAFMAMVCFSLVNSKGDSRNSGAGYRTKRSMLSKENWNLAHKTFGCYALGIFFLEGAVLLLEHKLLIPKKLLLSEQAFYLNIALLFLSTLVGIIFTEARLKKNK